MLYFAVMIGVAVLVYRFLIPALFPFLAALFIASQLKKLAGFLSRHSRAGHRAAAAASVFGFYGVVVSLFWVAGTYGTRAATRFAARLPELYATTIRPGMTDARQQIQQRLVGIAPELAVDVTALFDMLLIWMGDLVSKFSTSAVDWLGGLIGHMPEILLGTIFTVVLTFLITADYSSIASFIMRQIPRDLRQNVLHLKDFLFSTLRCLLKAYFIIMLATFAMLAIGLTLLRIPGSIRVAALIAIMDILPILGSGMVFLPWAGYCFLTDNVPLGVGLIILFALIETVRNFIEPHIVGDQIGLHPVATIVSSFIGLKLMGFGGILIAPILALTAKYLNESNILRLYR